MHFNWSYFQAPFNEFDFTIEDTSQYQDRFILEAETGRLYLRRSLVGESINQYTVSQPILTTDVRKHFF
jgi:hypothetical protein